MPGLPLRTLSDVWCNTVAKYPRKTALIMAGRSYTYRDLNVDVAKLAGYLLSAGVKPGDRIAVAMPNCLEFYIAYWATQRVGAILAPVNFRLGEPEMTYVFGNIDPVVVFVHAMVWPQVQPSLTAAIAKMSAPPQLVGVDVETAKPFAEALAEGQPTDPVPVSDESIAVIAHTSGTTGVPKGAMMRHLDLLYNMKNTIIPFSWRHEDVNLLLTPLFHVVALYSIVPSSAYLGATVVVAPRADAHEVVEIIEKERVTNFLSTPTFHQMVVSLPDIAEHDLSCLRMIGYSGAPMPVRTIQRLRELFPTTRLHNFFGLTETSCLTHITPSEAAESHADSIGIVIPDVGVRIVGEDGADCPYGEVGQLYIHRSSVIPGYWRRPGLLEEALTPDGEWFNTGDLARLDEDGYVYLEGRKKDMIIVAGENVFALEVERCILSLDGVKEVAVVGVPATGVRAALGELVKAVVVPLPGSGLTPRDVKRHCVERLATYKVPAIVELSEGLPRNPSGKVLKNQLK